MTDKLYTQLTDKEKARVREAGDSGLTSGPTIPGFTQPVDYENYSGLHELTDRGRVYYETLEALNDYPSVGSIRPYAYAFAMLTIIVVFAAVLVGVVLGACMGVSAVLFGVKDPGAQAYMGTVVGSMLGGMYALVWSLHKALTEWINWNRDFR